MFGVSPLQAAFRWFSISEAINAARWRQFRLGALPAFDPDDDEEEDDEADTPIYVPKK